MKNKQCQQCKGDMQPKREGAKFCSGKCRSDYNNQLRRNDILAGIRESRRMYHPVRPCIVCGAEFKPVRSTNRYCGTKCRVKHNNDLYAAKKAAIDNGINDLI